MLRFSVLVSPLKRPAAILSMFVASLVVVSTASAALLDFNVANGDYNTSGNWINYADNSTAAVPTNADEAIVRNNGTLNITAANGDANALVLRVGAGAQSGDPAGPLTPPAPYGGGTLNFTGGNILGGAANGARLNVGERDNTNNINYTGIVNQSGGKIGLNLAGSFLVVGSSGTTPSPTSQYNLSGSGIIGVVAGSGNSNNGINVRNGTFNMTGGSIVTDGAGAGQRFLTISSTSGTAGNENVATANFSGGTVDVKSGVRMASSANSKAYMTISGTADIKIIGSDFQMGVNGTNAYAQVDMSGGSLSIGSSADSGTRRLIIGDSTATAGNTGVFNLSGGTVNLYNSLVVGNNGGTTGLLNQTGGTLTVRSVELNRSAGSYDPLNDSAVISINGPNALFKQENNASGTGQLSIGQEGRGRFEVLQGEARIREIRVSEKTTSRATLKVAGGKLVVQDGLNRTDASAATIPNIILTGGELELTAPGGIIQWQANMELQGTRFDSKPGALLQTNLGNSTRPGNFSLNTGSIWDLDIANGTLTGADFVDVNNGSAALNGGLLNISLLGGYTPNIGDEVRILRNLINGVSLGSVAVSDSRWQPIVAASGTEIHLVYVPEPSSMLLFTIGLAMFSATRRTSRE